MARKMRIKKKSHKAGLEPGSLVRVGDPAFEAAEIIVTRYGPDGIETCDPKTVDECLATSDGRVTWVNVAGVHDAEIIRKIGRVFNIHQLTLEDIMNTDHLAKFNSLGGRLFMILKSLTISGGKPHEIHSAQVSIYAGEGYVVSFQETTEDLFKPVRKRMAADMAPFVKMGSGYLAYSLLDVTVDHYFEILEMLDEAIYELEESTGMHYDEETMKKIQSLRREVIFVRRAVWPLREVISGMQKVDAPVLSLVPSVFLSDVYDHVVQIIDTTETFREVISNIFDIYLTSAGNRINEVMKVLAMIATGILPMTLVTGLYGMNFKYMPEIRWRYGYPFSILLMFTIAFVMIYVFKKKKWI